jgi:LysR family transcriptional regulator of gallate degradation
MMGVDAMRLRRLMLFDAVCDAGGIGKAAALVGMTQPAVSQAIGKLELEFGAMLFERGFSGSELTGEGALLHRRVRRMLDQLAVAVIEAAGGKLQAGLHDAQVHGICRRLTDAQLRCHIAIAQHGSAVEAARRLGVSEPAVHRAGRQLEDTVGITLYRRRVHSVTVNPAGLAFARRLSVALHELEQAGSDLAAARGQAGGQVVVGVLPLLPQLLLARTIARLRASYPDAAVTIHEGSHAQLMGALQFGAVDIIVGALRSPRLEGAVVETALFADPYVVVVRRGHALASRTRIGAAELARHDWVVPQRDMPRRQAVEALFGMLPARPRVAVETSSLSMMMTMLAESDCVSLLSRSHLLFGSYRDDVVALEVPTPDKDRTVGYTARGDWLATPIQLAFIDCLRAECGAPLVTGPASPSAAGRKASAPRGRRAGSRP